MKDFRNDREAHAWFELNYPDMAPREEKEWYHHARKPRLLDRLWVRVLLAFGIAFAFGAMAASSF